MTLKLIVFCTVHFCANECYCGWVGHTSELNKQHFVDLNTTVCKKVKFTDM